jgi:hypothetical protein
VAAAAVRNNTFHGAPDAGERVAFWGEATLQLEHNSYYPEEARPAQDEGALAGDARFVDAAAGDLHLRADSPAIDAALPLTDASTTDVDGDVRGALADLGADERSSG